ncbi:MAG: iron-containing redox enzyme family protein [Myxococcaceae bacterium]
MKEISFSQDDRTPREVPDTGESPLFLERLHRTLARWNGRRLRPDHPTRRWREDLEEDLRMRTLEGEWLEAERAAVAPLVREVPRRPADFVRWFDALRQGGPGQGDPLFDWIAERATLDELRWFMRQELAGEAGFDDLVALTQLKMPPRSKLELARNYWDEMGRGNPEATHGGLLDRLGEALDIQSDGLRAVWEALALSNLLLGLAANRRYAWHAVGALGVVELTAPDRAERVDRGLKRLGVGGKERVYFALHATLDREHSARWDAEVLAPLVEEDPDRAPFLAEGAYLRLRAGARCYRRYRSELGVPR